MEFEMAGETEDWLIFEKDGSGVELCKLLTSSNQMTKNLTSELKILPTILIEISYPQIKNHWWNMK